MASPVWISTSSGDWNVGANWSTGSVPTTGDSPVFNGTGTANVTTNLTQGSVALGTIYIYQTNTCQIGTLVNGVPTYLQHASASVLVGIPSAGTQQGTGSPLLLFDSGSTACVYEIFNSSASSSDPAFGPVQVKGSSVTLQVTGGILAFACRPGETGTAAVNVIAANNTTTPSIFLGVGATVSTLNMLAGTVLSESGQTLVTGNINGGTYQYIGTGAHTTLNVANGATAIYAGTGTITTLNLTGTFDHTQDTRTITITNTNLYEGFSLLLNNGVAGSTIRTNAPVLVKCGMQDGTFTTADGDLV